MGHELTPEERAYIVNDCRIVAQALKIQFDKGLTKMTNASDALNGYKGIIGKGFFEKWFPILPVELDDDIRQAYRGGFTYLTPRFKNKHVKGGITLILPSCMTEFCRMGTLCILKGNMNQMTDTRYTFSI